MSHLIKRFMTGFFLIMLLYVICFYTGLLLQSFFSLVVYALLVREYTQIHFLQSSNGPIKNYFFILFFALGSISLINWSYLHPFLSALVHISSVFWLLVLPAVLVNFQKSYLQHHIWRSTLFYILNLFLLFSSWLSVIYLMRYDVQLLVILVLFVALADSLGFLFGRSIGQHKIAPDLSPGKTYEGLWGAWIVIFLLLIFFRSYHYHSLLYYALQSLSLPHLLQLSCLFVFFAFCGDLFQSALKRVAGVKDSGTLLPEHGGIYDRMDAYIVIFPIMLPLCEWYFKVT